MKKIILYLFFITTFSFSSDIIKIFNNYNNKSLDMSTIELKKFKRDFDNYAYIKINSNIREKPNTDSKIVTKVFGEQRLEVLELVVNRDFSLWYKIKTSYGKEGYILSNLVYRREYNFNNAIKLADKINNFITKYKNRLKVVAKFIPLDSSTTLAPDKKGNYSNQSVTVYTDINRTDYYNLQDRTIFSIIGETSDYYIIVSPLYKEKLYFPKEQKKFIKNFSVQNKIKKFIYISKLDQNEISFELVKNNTYKLVTVADITTGKHSKFGFETPNGAFLVDITKPKMFYLKDGEGEQEISGEANFAIRFSGGAYIHGIPVLYKPEETFEERKEQTISLLGTYEISHKCVRNYDEIAEKLYNWIDYKKINEANHRIPKDPVIVIVE